MEPLYAKEGFGMDTNMVMLVQTRLSLRAPVRERSGNWSNVQNPHPDVWGDASLIWGDASGIWGDVSGLRGDVSGILSGDVSVIHGDVSGISGHVYEIYRILTMQKDPA